MTLGPPRKQAHMTLDELIKAARPEFIADWDDADWKALAVHEAGHAVAAIVLGILVESVSIVPTEEWSGSVTLSPRSAFFAALGARTVGASFEPWGPRAIREQALMSLAGPSAETHFTGLPSLGPEGYGYDAARMLVEILGLSESEMRAEILVLSDAARKFVERHWHVIEFVAQHLLEHRTLSGRRLRKMVHRALAAQAATTRLGERKWRLGELSGVSGERAM